MANITNPNDLQCTLIYPFHKISDGINILRLQRNLTSTIVTYTLIFQRLLNRAQQKLEHNIGDYQAGFRQNCHVLIKSLILH